MKFLSSRRLFAGVAILSFSFLGACGAVCGDGKLDADEQCDDTNNVDGDGCDAVCVFEDSGTDFRISELALVDPIEGSNRFGQTNLLLNGAVGNNDQAVALNFLIQFDATIAGDTKATFGPGSFDDADETFSFLVGDEAVADITIDEEGNISFVDEIDLNLPVEEVVGGGVFQNLPIKNTLITSTFVKKQVVEGGPVLDELELGQITAQVALADLCIITISLAVGQEPIALLDIFDDGTPGNDSSNFVDCLPCEGAGVDVDTCVLPDIDPDPNIAGDELYSVEAAFEAEAIVVK